MTRPINLQHQLLHLQYIRSHYIVLIRENKYLPGTTQSNSPLGEHIITPQDKLIKLKMDYYFLIHYPLSVNHVFSCTDMCFNCYLRICLPLALCRSRKNFLILILFSPNTTRLKETIIKQLSLTYYLIPLNIWIHC